MKTINMELSRGAFLTDIHFGKKSNSDIHNQDCINYLTWFCEQVKSDPSIDYIAFLGDWHESRTAIDVSTLDYSYKGASMLNDLGLPVFFIVGNHDLGKRLSRALYSTIAFNEFENFIVVDEITAVVSKNTKSLFSPFLLANEYASAFAEFDESYELWAGHFEFQGFVLTGYSIKLEHGPDIADFTKPKRILSGHFHKRQTQANTTYIGNTFPMDFGDANDFKRGLAIYQHDTYETSFIDWPDCPKYIKGTLGDLLDDKLEIQDNSYVAIEIDIPIDFEELAIIEESYSTKYNIRELKLDESSKFIQALETELDDDDIDDEGMTTEDLIVEMLKLTDNDKFNHNTLVSMFRGARK